MSHAAMNWALQQRELRPATKIVLLCLCDRHNPDFGCFPSQARLAEDCEMSPRSVRDHLAILESKGLIRRVKRIGGGGAYISDMYVFAFEDRFKCEEQDPAAKSASGKTAQDPAAKSAAGRRQNLPPNHVSINPVREPVSNVLELKSDCSTKKREMDQLGEFFDNEFELLWKYYPRKVAKAAARKEYEKARKKATFDEIKTALGTFIRLQRGTEKRLIPHLRTWLHQERWNDEQADAINRPATTDDQLDALNAPTTDDQLDQLFPEMRMLK